MTRRALFVASLMLVALVSNRSDSYAQALDSTLNEPIAVSARPGADSIILRWAPTSLKTWLRGNAAGYVVERFLMARGGNALTAPEKVVLTATPLKPLDMMRWESLVNRDRFAAIAAQALFGDRFDVSLSSADVFTIINKVRENEQRFAFALFSADMSPAVARASGLWFVDRTVKKGEKYLYRVLIKADGLDPEMRGSVFVSTDEPYALTKPGNLRADVEGSLVSLRWDKSRAGLYTAYRLERSSDGSVFVPTSDVPLVTLSPNEKADTRYDYATDSLADVTRTFYYRVKGVTPFGEESQPSEVVSVRATMPITDVPFIRDGGSKDNRSIQIEWEFPEKHNVAIKGFNVERSLKPQGIYKVLTLQAPLPAEARTYSDKTPEKVNYYRVTAHGLDGQQYRSPIYLAQLVDSLPPLPPSNLKAKVDEFGKVKLEWQANTEPDMFGYRIYRSNHETEEMSQVTTEPIADTGFEDQVDLNTLNEVIYYKVMAIDRNQNHSDLSPILKVILPDKVKPMPPVFLPVASNENGISLSWMRSSSKDVVSYELYRRLPQRDEWQRIKMVQANQDSVFIFLDDTAEPGRLNTYTITAVDEAGLESEPATPVTGSRIDTKLRAPIVWKDPVIQLEKKTVLLTWAYDAPNVSGFRIYRSDGENMPVMYKTIPADKREFADVVRADTHYTYQIIVLFSNGSKSILSKELAVKL